MSGAVFSSGSCEIQLWPLRSTWRSNRGRGVRWDSREGPSPGRPSDPLVPDDHRRQGLGLWVQRAYGWV